MLRVASSVCNRIGNTAGRSVVDVAAKTSSRNLEERPAENWGNLDHNASKFGIVRMPPAESKPFDVGESVLLEFDSMAAYTVEHRQRKPFDMRSYQYMHFLGCFDELPGEIEEWVVEWESIKLAWDACAQMAMDCDSLDARIISNIVNRCKTGGYVNRLFLAVLLDRMQKGNGKGWRLRQVQMSMIVQSLGMLARCNRDAGMDVIFGTDDLMVGQDATSVQKQAGRLFEEQCLGFTYSLLQKVSRTGFPETYAIRSLSCILHGLGLLYRDEIRELDFASRKNELVPKMVDSTVLSFCRKAETEPFLPVNLSQVLHACASLNSTIHAEKLCNLVEHSMRRGVFFNEQDISNIVWALGRLNVGSATLFEMLWVAIMQNRRQFSARGLSKVLHGLGLRALNGGHYPLVYDLQRLGWEITKPRRLKGFKNTELFMIVKGFGLLKFQDAAVMEALGGEINRRIQGRRDMAKAKARAEAEQRWRREMGPGVLFQRSYLEDGFEEEASNTTNLWEPEQVLMMETALGRSILKA